MKTYPPRQHERDSGEARRDLIAVCVLLVSFCYELPIANVIGYSRLNPRLFDLACVCALGLRLSSGPRGTSGHQRSHWMLPPLCAYVAACTWASLVTVTFLVPNDYGLSSLYFLMRHFQILLAVWLVATSRLSVRQTMQAVSVFLIAALAPLTAGVLEHAGLLEITRETASGDEIRVSGERIRSFLGGYVHYSMLSLLVLLLCHWLWVSSGGLGGWRRLLVVVCAPLAVLGIFLSEARAGPFGLAILVALAITSLLMNRSRARAKHLGACAIVVLAAYLTVAHALPADKTARVRSTVHLKLGREDDTLRPEPDEVPSRMRVALVGMEKHYQYHGPLFLLYGTGFYLSDLGGRIRRGYGIHNIHVFPLEQAGLPGFVAAIWLFWRLVARSYDQVRNAPSRFAQASGRTMLWWWAMVLVVGLGGQVFWYYGSMGHFFTNQLCVAALLVRSDGGLSRARKVR